ncbi:hypothetical protein EC915_102578 [Pseudomonas sp. LP_7_YM]|nr:hypothetical protein EC915_102578 [Pseudomonas sp. LP_7_YM]
MYTSVNVRHPQRRATLVGVEVVEFFALPPALPEKAFMLGLVFDLESFPDS